MGLVPPSSGDVQFDNQQINKHLEAWQSQIGLVPQSIYLIDDTIRKNIAFGEDDQEISTEALNNAIKNSQLTDMVASLPNGVDTVIGEDGGGISGGERQRIALARALYKSPKLLILDEATSSLDNQTEREILDTIFSLKGTCTIIMVSHKVETLQQCDDILSIENGKVTLKGQSHKKGSV